MIESLINNRDDIVGYVKFFSNYKGPEKLEGIMYLHDDNTITIDPPDNGILQGILSNRVGRFGEYYTAKDDPLRFLEYLHKYYRGSYFRASEFKRVKGGDTNE